MQGEISNDHRSINAPSYIVDGDPGNSGGGTYTAPGDSKNNPTLQDYENIFGPAARDVKLDLQRHKRHARWHLPDALKGSNPWIADRIDGLITDTSASPFTTTILPYMYIENVDQKIKWNRWSFDEGLSSRVPYESAARTLTQTKTSYAGYTVRQGLAITLEHNFMMSAKGRENFKNQLQQVVGSIQYTNDIDVHVALITAPSYAKERAEKYYTRAKTNHQIMREYIDLFGFMQKNPNAMDIMIEEAKSVLRSWGASEPSFLLTNSKLTFQMTMLPEKTEYLTHGSDGQKRLKTGPNIGSYRGLSIINSRSFSMEDGAPPRDVLRRRVRTAEYYRIPWTQGVESKEFSLYDESKDSWQKFTWMDLFRMAQCPEAENTGHDRNPLDANTKFISTKLKNRTGNDYEWNRRDMNADLHPERCDQLISREIWESMDWRTLRQEIPAAGLAAGAAGAGSLDAIESEDPFDIICKMVQMNGGNREANAGVAPNFEADYYLEMEYSAGNAGGAAYAQGNLSVERIRELWDVVDPTNAVNVRENDQQAYMSLVNDLKNFLQGNVRHMQPMKVWIFSLLNFYNSNSMRSIIHALFDFTQPSASTGTPLINATRTIFQAFAEIKDIERAKWEIVIVRPNIEHNMLGIVMGRGGIDELGATLWGQTELSVYDDSMHGIWGMSYKYNERAIVFNHKNLIRLWDIAYDGYNGGKDCRSVNWVSDRSIEEFKEDTYELNKSYEGVSMMVMKFKNVDTSDPWPSPIVFHDTLFQKAEGSSYIDGEHQHQVKKDAFRVFNRAAYKSEYKNYMSLMPNFSKIHNPKNAGTCSEENETSCNCLAFQGTMRIHTLNAVGGVTSIEEISGNGHHGVDVVGMASIRSGKGIAMGSMNSMASMTKII